MAVRGGLRLRVLLIAQPVTHVSKEDLKSRILTSLRVPTRGSLQLTKAARITWQKTNPTDSQSLRLKSETLLNALMAT